MNSILFETHPGFVFLELKLPFCPLNNGNSTSKRVSDLMPSFYKVTKDQRL